MCVLSQFAERYEPNAISEVIFPTTMAQMEIEAYLNISEGGHPGSILLYGPFGSGKTTLVRLIAKQVIGDDYELSMSELTGTQFNTVGQIRSAIQPRFKVNPIAKYHAIIIDELCSASVVIQKELRSLIERNKKDGLFLFTANDLDKIDPGVRSRCFKVEFGKAPTALWLPYARLILTKNGVSIPDHDIEMLLNSSHGDIREIMRALHMIVMQSKK